MSVSLRSDPAAGLALPLVDVSALMDDSASPASQAQVAEAIRRACCEQGFFYITGHGIDPGLQRALVEGCQAFFARPQAEKLAIEMRQGGRAWRGYFPVGGELTSGQPDQKEGLYFGQELGPDHPRVLAGTPLHGQNLFPRQPPGLSQTVLAYIDALTTLGHRLMAGISLSLGLPADYFHRHYTADPTVLFRVFHYPPQPAADTESWGVGEHTDYGVLTLLKQDAIGGLQVKHGGQWLEAPPVADTFVCNLGDMLERMTRGLYRSTPHRVRNTSGQSRLSFPFFFDPGWDSQVLPLPSTPVLEAARPSQAKERWDGQDVHAFSGTYGEYLLAKVSKAFPNLAGAQTTQSAGEQGNTADT
jgi:isopenicillin N synthase-like dioxygenase